MAPRGGKSMRTLSQSQKMVMVILPADRATRGWVGKRNFRGRNSWHGTFGTEYSAW